MSKPKIDLAVVIRTAAAQKQAKKVTAIHLVAKAVKK